MLLDAEYMPYAPEYLDREPYDGEVVVYDQMPDGAIALGALSMQTGFVYNDAARLSAMKRTAKKKGANGILVSDGNRTCIAILTEGEAE